MKLRGLTLAALALALFGIRLADAQGGSPVKELRLLDVQGQPLEREELEPGDYIFRLPEATTGVTAAFDFSGTQATDVKLRILGTEGVPIFEESRQVDAPGTVSFTYDAKDQPLEVGEYVVNLYVGKESYLSDSVQLYVGAANPPVSQATKQAETALAAATADPAAGAAAEAGAGDAAASPVDAEAPSGSSLTGSRSLLILAGVGLLALLGIVLWAGRSAMRRG